jgi:hypothetical protein
MRVILAGETSSYFSEGSSILLALASICAEKIDKETVIKKDRDKIDLHFII